MKMIPLLRSTVLATTFFAIITFCSCHKSQIIQTHVFGTVTDGATGLPLSGVSIRFTVSWVETKGGNPVVRNILSTTGSDGTYSFLSETEYPSQIGFTAEKKGYLPKLYKEVNRGDDLQYDFKMHPIDAVLKIKARNENNSIPRLYFRLGNELYENYSQFCSPWPLLIPQGDSVENIFQVPGGRDMLIYWGADESVSWNPNTPRFSVFCPRNDTTEFVLTF